MATITIGPGITLGPGITFGPMSSASITDPYFQYVTLLLSGDGTNGAQNNTFTDSSTNNFAITRAGNTTQGTFSPYGANWSNYFNASTDWLSLSGPNLSGLTNFTFECWVNFNGFQSDTKYFLAVSGGSYYQLVHDSSAGISFRAGPGYAKIVGESSNSGWSTGTWYHVALVKNGTNYTIYKNGVAIATNTDSTPLASINIGYIGGYSSTTGLNAYMSNARITNTAVYTSAFTPPTAPLTAISGTSLLTCQSNRFIDNSTNNFTITRSGTPSVQRFSPFSPSAAYSAATIGGSGYFDGSGDWVTTPNVSAFDLSSSTTPFTIEAWLYISDNSTFRGIIAARQNAIGHGWCLYINTNNTLYMGSTIVGQSYADRQMNTTVIPPNTWAHIALVKTNLGYTAYVNGVGGTLLALTGGLDYQSGQPVVIGALGSQGEYPFLGYISQARIVNGTAVYTSNFTPPTAPLTAIANTQLLTNFTNGGITDTAMINDLETVGNAQISTSVKKYGSGSLAFDGSGDYLTAPSNAIYAFGTGDFTVECWVYLAVGSKVQVIFDTRVSGPSSTGIALAINASNAPYVYVNAATLFTSSTALTLATWTHVAMVKASGTITLYINGTSTGSAASATNLTDNALTIGSVIDYRDGSTTYHLNGYVDDLRITRGYARYTSNFTPPEALS